MDSNFPKRLSHDVPYWVPDGSVFHIRIRIRPQSSTPLTHTNTAKALLKSVEYYHNQFTWHVHLFVLMPDHLHALLSFNPSKKLSDVISSWKSYHAKKLEIEWQDNFFDHRIRNEEELSLKYQYILNNPVASCLCDSPDKWPWKIQNPRA